jgi:HlyD family secretion protein
MKKWLTLILLLTLLTACGEDVPLLGSEPTPTVDFNTLTVDTGVDVVSAEGQIVPLRRANLTFRASGRVAEILVANGDRVEAGQPLIRLDAREQELQVEEAETAVIQAKPVSKRPKNGWLQPKRPCSRPAGRNGRRGPPGAG